MGEAIVLAHAASVLVLVGIIWTVQLVHYPLLADVDPARFPAAHAAHSRAITLVVGPPWVVEGVTTAALIVAPPTGAPRWLVGAAAALAVVPVAVTIGWSVPAHARLAAGFDAAVHARLVASNRVRVAAWTAHAVVAVALWLRTG